MSVKIENLTTRPVLLRFNSGRTLHLAPGATEADVPESDVNHNVKVRKLQERRLIALHAGETGRTSAQRSKKRKKAPKRKKEDVSRSDQKKTVSNTTEGSTTGG